MLAALIDSFVATEPQAKCRALRVLRASAGNLSEILALSRSTSSRWPSVSDVGVPARPRLIEPRDLPRRGLGSPAGHAAFVHAICHIEFTAINLALDAVLRFVDMPTEYYRDWVNVACDEAEHFELLAGHLQSLGYGYGDFPAHAGLWDVAVRTADDVMRRMALVPRVLEARGLDVTPPMIARLDAIGDQPGAEILRRIYRDEITHVEAGSRWFCYAAERRGLCPETVFSGIVADEFGAIRKNKLNLAARRKAGFSEAELSGLAGR